jgi:WD40 repeat protein
MDPASQPPKRKGRCCTGCLGLAAFLVFTCIVWTFLTRLPTPQYLAGQAANVRALSFTPDGKVLAVGHDAGIRVWNTDSGVLLVSSQTGTAHAEVSPDAAHLAVDSGVCRLHDLALVTDYGRPGVTPYGWSPDGKVIAGTTRTNDPTAWKAHLFRLADRTPLTSSENVFPWGPVAWSPDGSLVAYPGPAAEILVFDRTLTLVKTLDDPANAALPRPGAEGRRLHAALAFSADGRRLFSVGANLDFRIRSYSLETGIGKPLFGASRITPETFMERPHVSCAAISVVRGEWAWGTIMGRLELHDLETATSHGSSGERPAYGVSAVAFSKDGKLLASGGGDDVVRLRRLR